MPTFTTPNSQHSYTIPSDAAGVEVTIAGGTGGQGGDSGGAGGAGGSATAVIPVDVLGGRDVAVYVGEGGADGVSDAGGAGGSVPYNTLSGGAGGDGSYTDGGGGGGGGGAPSLITGPNGVAISAGGGGGGDGGTAPTSNPKPGGGGGGARGGAGGTSDNEAGEDGDGSGAGGDGADAAANSQTPGGDGGTVAATGVTVRSTGTSTAGPSVEIVPRYPPAAPQSLSVTTDETDASLSWTDDDTATNTDPEDGYRIYKSRDGGATETQLATLVADSESYQATGLLNGEQYQFRIEAYNGAGAASSTVTDTTTLPDAGQPSLDNGIEDEITANYGDVSNYGSYRGQIRETGQSAWDSSATGFQEVVVDQSQSSITSTGLEDGEAYEVRIRTETEHVTGTWTLPATITTAFPTPASVSATVDSATQVTVSWSGQADNEDGFEILRTRTFGDGSRTRLLATLDPNTETYVDDEAQPSAQYSYEVRAFTEDAEASGSASATTPSLGTGATPTDSAGWTVEIERSDGTVRRPSILDDPSIRPTLNDRPEVEVAVRPDDSWLSEDWEDSAMRVWRDGDRIPIDRLARVSPEPDRTVLVGRGGDELLERVQQDFDDVTAEAAIQSILDTVNYSSTVDPAPTADNELLTTLDSTEALSSAAQSLSGPRAVDNGQAKPKQSAVIVPPGDISSGKIVTSTQWNWTASEALELDVGARETTGFSIDLPYPLASENWGLYWRISENYEGFVEVFVNGQRLGENSAFDADRSEQTVSWASAILPGGINTAEKFDISGTVDITFEATSGPPPNDVGPIGEAYIDSVVLFDTRRWDPTAFSNTLDSNNFLDGPPGLYAPVDFDFDARPIRRATGGRVEASVSSTANDQAVAVSPNGESFTTTTNGTSVEADFESSTGQFVSRVTLGGVDGDGTGSNVETTVTRYRTQPQTLETLTLKYDSIDSPGVSETVDATVADALSKYADRANLIWELQYDDGFQVVVTRPGQRTSAADPDLVDWRVDKDIEAEATRAIVHGRNKQIESETFTAELNDIQLNNDAILKGSTRVYDDSGTEYVRGENEDYVVNHVLGTIKMPDLGSDLTEGNTYNIDYEAEVIGDFVGDRHIERRQPEIVDIPQIITESQADQAALYIVAKSEGPVVSAQATLARQDIGYRLTEALDLSALPDVGNLRVREITESPREVVLELGLGQSVGDVVDEIRSSLSDTARQT